MFVRSRSLVLLAAAAALVQGPPAFAQVTALVGGTIIDGTGRTPVANGIVIVWEHLK